MLYIFLGGGDLSNFQRKNFFTNDKKEKETIESSQNITRADSVRIKDISDLKLNTNRIEEEKKEDKLKKEESVKKAEGTPSFFNNIKSFFL